MVSCSGMFTTGLLGGVTKDGEPGELGKFCGIAGSGELGTGGSPWLYTTMPVMK